MCFAHLKTHHGFERMRLGRPNMRMERLATDCVKKPPRELLKQHLPGAGMRSPRLAPGPADSSGSGARATSGVTCRSKRTEGACLHAENAVPWRTVQRQIRVASKLPKEHPECLGNKSSGNVGRHRVFGGAPMTCRLHLQVSRRMRRPLV